MQKRLIGLIKIAIVLILVVSIGVLGTVFAARAYPPLLSVWSALRGATDVCGRQAAIRGVLAHYAITETAAAMDSTLQLVEEDPVGYQCWKTPDGLYWVPSATSSALPVLAAQQLHDIYGAIHPGDIVLDCGAHIGLYARRALAMGAAMVVAIEPAQENIECLRRNFRDEITSGKLVLYPKGLWDQEDTLLLHTVEGNSAGDSLVLDLGTGEEYEVPVTTIDHVVSELSLDKVDFIKLDIKGAEKQALAGATQTLRRFKPRLAVAAEHLPGDSEAIPRAIEAARDDYMFHCGSCFMLDLETIRPEVLLFR